MTNKIGTYMELEMVSFLGGSHPNDFILNFRMISLDPTNPVNLCLSRDNAVFCNLVRGSVRYRLLTFHCLLGSQCN